VNKGESWENMEGPGYCHHSTSNAEKKGDRLGGGKEGKKSWGAIAEKEAKSFR